MAAEPLFHIAVASEWEAAKAAGAYERSTRGLSLAEVGFIHCSRRHQVLPTARRYYADEPQPLVVLVIDPDRLVAPVFDEPAPSGEQFPHLFGVLPVDAVVDVLPLRRVGSSFVDPLTATGDR